MESVLTMQLRQTPYQNEKNEESYPNGRTG